MTREQEMAIACGIDCMAQIKETDDALREGQRLRDALVLRLKEKEA